ncbi:unnamed protein product, partial [Clonostachys rosea f. rosea IK726]
MGNPPLVVKLKRSTGGNMATPYMLFICLGQNKDGEKLHNLVHIGCIRECMAQWDELYKLRDAARNHRLGDATINAWEDWYYTGAGIRSDDERRTAIFNVGRALLQGTRGWHCTSRVRKEAARREAAYLHFFTSSYLPLHPHAALSLSLFKSTYTPTSTAPSTPAFHPFPAPLLSLDMEPAVMDSAHGIKHHGASYAPINLLDRVSAPTP